MLNRVQEQATKLARFAKLQSTWTGSSGYDDRRTNSEVPAASVEKYKHKRFEYLVKWTRYGTNERGSWESASVLEHSPCDCADESHELDTDKPSLSDLNT